MWIWLAVASAVMLGLYDVAKKQSLRRNGVLYVLLVSSALSTLFLSPFLSAGRTGDHLRLLFKAVLVTTSWISGLEALRFLPMTTASTIKASRPVFVLLFSLILFGETLNALQWSGVVVTLLSLFLLSFSSKKEGIDFTHNRGVAFMCISVLAGVASALYDKHIMGSLTPLFVQSWCNLYITVLLALCLSLQHLVIGSVQEDGTRLRKLPPFHWDWTLVLISIFITIADFLYFSTLKCDGALLSIVSLTRRGSAIVAFACGAALFKEQRIREKATSLAILFIGMVLIVLGSHN